MSTLMSPASLLFRKLSPVQARLLMAALLGVPVWIVFYQLVQGSSAPWQDAGVMVVAAGYLLAAYVMVGHQLQVKAGFAGLREAITRFSAGDLDYRGQASGEMNIVLGQLNDEMPNVAVHDPGEAVIQIAGAQPVERLAHAAIPGPNLPVASDLEV